VNGLTGRGFGCFDSLIYEFGKSLESDHHMTYNEMSTINFNLRNPKANTRTTICLIYRWNNKKIKLSTRLSIHPRDWNANKQRVKKGKVIGKSYNDILDHYEITMTKLILKQDKSHHSITAVVIKSELFGIPTLKPPKCGLMNYMKEFISRKQNTWSRSTYSGYCNKSCPGFCIGRIKKIEIS
jgi:hypothetical protein